MQRGVGGKKQPATINTKHILFIVSGAFDGLQKIVQRRLREAVIGFAASSRILADEEVLREAHTRDFIDFGFEPEFIGRLPVIASVGALDRDALVRILTQPKNALVRQYQRMFAIDGVELEFTETAVEAVAEQALLRGTGARGLRAIMEEVLQQVMFDVPSRDDVEKVVITREVVQSKEKPITLIEKAG